MLIELLVSCVRCVSMVLFASLASILWIISPQIPDAIHFVPLEEEERIGEEYRQGGIH